MASQLDLPLPEITIEDFHRLWTRFELVASAKEWDAAKQKPIATSDIVVRQVSGYLYEC